MLELNRGAPADDTFVKVVYSLYMEHYKDYGLMPRLSELQDEIWVWIEEELETIVIDEFYGDKRMEDEDFRDRQYEKAMETYCCSEEACFLEQTIAQCLVWLKLTIIDDVSEWSTSTDDEELVFNSAQLCLFDKGDDEYYEYGGI